MGTKVEIFTGANCAYCFAAKNLLKAKGLDYEEFRIDQDPARLQEMLQRSASRRTVPQIFINGEHIGGFEDLAAAERSGKLAQLIGAAA
ncbi:glutaredoxin 3 [Rudaea cellulosilytica]|uniref:glutaredoxin 3 n=1 Tax=Rudaea cellulosilytica TaxID=540746 RepID=UPI000380117B|nr:glutaredoxin 3 [Rudaea cellulosilytica]